MAYFFGPPCIVLTDCYGALSIVGSLVDPAAVWIILKQLEKSYFLIDWINYSKRVLNALQKFPSLTQEKISTVAYPHRSEFQAADAFLLHR